MSSYLNLDVERLLGPLLNAIQNGLNEEADRAVEDARRLAPVRKIFDQGKLGKLSGGRQRRKISVMDADQIAKEAHVRQSLGLGPAVLGVNRTVAKRTIASELVIGGKNDIRRISSMNIRNLKDRRAESLLTAKGRYELRKARALSVESAEKRMVGRGGSAAEDIRIVHTVRLGGKLRQSIHRTPILQDGPSWTVWIVAGNEEVDYAKYVEFGTRHAPAQPFMRPMARMVSRRVGKTIKREMKRISSQSSAARNARTFHRSMR